MPEKSMAAMPGVSGSGVAMLGMSRAAIPCKSRAAMPCNSWAAMPGKGGKEKTPFIIIYNEDQASKMFSPCDFPCYNLSNKSSIIISLIRTSRYPMMTRHGLHKRLQI